MPAPHPPVDDALHPDPRVRRLRGLALSATALTFLLVSIGALVRATGSGDACPDWPRCHGSLIPRWEYHVLIEYSHRLTAFLDIVAIAALAVYAWRGFRRERRVAVPAVAAFGLVIVQALLGAVVVWSKLEAVNVTLHLATAMLLVASVVLATVGAFTLDVASTGLDRLRTQAWWTAGTVYALLVVGALVRGEGAGLAFKDWPLMDGRLVPSLDRVGPAVQFVHRGLALVAGVLVVWLALRARALRAERPETARWASVAAGLFAAQVLLGAANVWTGLATWAVVGHVLLASLVWGALVATASMAGVEATRSTVPAGRGRGAGVRAPGDDGHTGLEGLPASVTVAKDRT
jgi:cytochrome c oxidase assembly protein subunit 15